MSLKNIWKERSIDRNQKPRAAPPVPTVFVPMSFEEIRDKLAEALKEQMPPNMAIAIDNPSSVIGGLINAIAAVDVDLYKQADTLIKYLADNKVKVK